MSGLCEWWAASAPDRGAEPRADMKASEVVAADGAEMIKYAAKGGKTETVQELLDVGITIDIQDDQGYTPLVRRPVCFV